MQYYYHINCFASNGGSWRNGLDNRWNINTRIIPNCNATLLNINSNKIIKKYV